MATRGPAGDHLRKRGGIWFATIYVDGMRTERSTGCTDRKAARAVLAIWERAAADPTAAISQTLNDCLQTLLDDRRGRTSAENLSFISDKTRPLVTILGHETSIASFVGAEARIGKRYVTERRAMGTGDRTIARELKILRRALKGAKASGVWSGDPEQIIPPDFEPSPAPMGDAISRKDALRIFPRMTPDSAAAMAFALATASEMSALRRVLRADLAGDLSRLDRIRIRGTKNEHRNADVPIVTDEQRTLLAYARRHGKGKGDRIFGGLHRLDKELSAACRALHLTVISPHDLRRSAGQWLVDLGCPLELVSKFMRHSDVRTTQRFYASVRRETLGDRIVDAIDPRYATKAHRARRKARPVVETISSVPEPRQLGKLYKVDGVSRRLAEWASHSGIAKATLYGRVVTRGMSMEAAIALGRSPHLTGGAAAVAKRGREFNCRTGAAVSVDGGAQNGQKAPPREGSAFREIQETPGFLLRAGGADGARTRGLRRDRPAL